MSQLLMSPDSDEIQLKNGDVVSLVFISDKTSYNKYIQYIIAAAIPYKDIVVMYLDYTTNKPDILKNKDKIFKGGATMTTTADDYKIPVLLIFLNRILYHTILYDKLENIQTVTANIQHVLTNIYSTFIVKKNFLNPESANIEYVFHDTDTAGAGGSK
jgi:hypothetical protein